MSQANTSYLPPIFLGSASFVFLNFGLPIRADDLGINAVMIGGMYTIFTGTLLLLRPLVGYCLDQMGRKWFFTCAFVFYVLAMLVFSQSVDIYDFYLARFLQGIGASIMWVSARTIIADLHDENNRGTQMGRLTTTSVRGAMLGAMYGFTLLGFMPMQSAWSWAFIGYACLSLMAFIWSAVKIKESRPVSKGDTTPAPTQLKLLKDIDLRRLLVIVFLTAFASSLIEPIYLIFLKNKFELNVMMLALAFLPSGLVYAILPAYAGKWSDRWGRGLLIAIGVTFAGIVSMILPLWPAIWMVAASYVLFSAGWALASPAVDALVADMAPAQSRGTVLGIKEGAAGAGAALGPLAGGFVFEYWSQELAFVINGVLLLCAASFTLYWFRQR